MKIKIGKLREYVTSFANRFYIEIQDSEKTSNMDLKQFVDKEVSVVIGEIQAIDDLIEQVDVL